MTSIIRIFHFLVSLFVFIIIVVLLLFMLTKAGFVIYSIFTKDFFSSSVNEEILHEIAFAIVLVKAYKILIYYLKSHHLNIKFLVEIAIIAPTIELIFHVNKNSIWVNCIYAFFAIFNLLIYLYYYDKLKKIADSYKEEDHVPFRSIKKLVNNAKRKR